MKWGSLAFDKRAYDAAMRRMGPVLIDRPSAEWLDRYRDRYRMLYRCERLRLAAAASPAAAAHPAISNRAAGS